MLESEKRLLEWKRYRVESIKEKSYTYKQWQDFLEEWQEVENYLLSLVEIEKDLLT